MRINGHAHIFSLLSVLSDEAVSIMAGRLRGLGLREFVVEAVETLLQDQLDRPEYLVEDELLVRFMEAVSRSTGFRDLLRARTLPVEVRILGSRGTRLEVRAMRAALDRLSSWIDANDGPGKSPFDVFETLRIAMQPSIPRVASKLLTHLGPDDAIVALMMDIVAEDEPARDRRNFLGQIQGTMDAVVANPGRVLPFIAVNPRRPDHFEIMQRAIEERGFLGVKLYPSLGFEVTTPEMRKVLEYCEGSDVPLTIHSTATGFNRDAATAEFAHPRNWEPLLRDFESLRVCFAHCGGWGGFCGQEADQVEWADRILGYMDDYPNVYADLSYHVDMMLAGGEVERDYFRALKHLLDQPRGDRIVFGTDSWLLRLNIDDAAYWAYFEAKLTRAEFEKVAGTNPRRFLGLPSDGREPRENVRRHIEFLESQADRVGSPPADWVRSLSDADWRVVRSDPGWTANNRAHVATYNYFLHQIPPRLRRGGFEDASQLRLVQLEFFGGGGSTPSRRKLRGNARNLISHCTAYGGVPEAGHTDETIHEALVELLADGTRTLGATAGSIDALFRFNSEMVT